jgi:hypothetical protein
MQGAVFYAEGKNQHSSQESKIQPKKAGRIMACFSQNCQFPGG